MTMKLGPARRSGSVWDVAWLFQGLSGLGFGGSGLVVAAEFFAHG